MRRMTWFPQSVPNSSIGDGRRENWAVRSCARTFPLPMTHR